METFVFFAAAFFTFSFYNERIRAVPLNKAEAVDLSSNTVEDSGGAEEGAVIDDDFTTHGLERLSSAATCLVAGVEYTHGQQIYRPDPCEFCLCLDGEMFCWWQDCPPTMEGPCRDRGPYSPCLNSPASTSKNTHNTVEPSTTQAEAIENATSFSTFPSEMNTTEEVTATVQEQRFCLVMGIKYEIGAKLPHDTGNCVECICANGAKISCSPNQCAPAGEDINDYRPPGPRQSDVF